jgi:hypothetical protein
MKKAPVPSILVAVVLLAVAVIAEAQQATKASRDPKDKDVIFQQPPARRIRGCSMS